jgi:predicted metal-binding protein
MRGGHPLTGFAMDQSAPEIPIEESNPISEDSAVTLHVCVTCRACSAALTGPGRWSYIYGDLSEASVNDLLVGAARYAATPDGLVPWRERPTIFRKGVIARIPPFVAKIGE